MRSPASSAPRRATWASCFPRWARSSSSRPSWPTAFCRARPSPWVTRRISATTSRHARSANNIKATAKSAASQGAFCIRRTQHESTKQPEPLAGHFALRRRVRHRHGRRVRCFDNTVHRAPGPCDDGAVHRRVVAATTAAPTVTSSWAAAIPSAARNAARGSPTSRSPRRRKRSSTRKRSTERTRRPR